MSYPGMNAATGRQLDDMAHIRQSVRDILTTPIGTRVMRRDYGSLLPLLVDQPLNGATRLLVYAAIVMALMRWERRISLSTVDFSIDGPSLTADLTATRIDGPRAGQPTTLSVPLTGGA